MLRLIEAEEEKWRQGLETEEAKERERMEEEIRKAREKEEEVAAEPGHIATRRDDRFTTFISFTVAVSLRGDERTGGCRRLGARGPGWRFTAGSSGRRSPASCVG